MPKPRYTIQANDFQMSFNNSSLRECPVCHEPIQHHGDAERVKAVFLRLSGEGLVLKQGVDTTAFLHVGCFVGSLPIGIIEEVVDWMTNSFPGMVQKIQKETK